MTDTSSDVRLKVSLDADMVGMGGESFFGSPVAGSDDLFTVENVPLYSPIGFHDTVRAFPAGASDAFQVVEVVKRSPRASIMIGVLAADDRDSERSKALVAELLHAIGKNGVAQGWEVELAIHDFLIAQLPEGVVPVTQTSDTFPDMLPVVNAVFSAANVMHYMSPAGGSLDVGWSVHTSPGDPVGVPAGIRVR